MSLNETPGFTAYAVIAGLFTLGAGWKIFSSIRANNKEARDYLNTCVRLDELELKALLAMDPWQYDEETDADVDEIRFSHEGEAPRRVTVVDRVMDGHFYQSEEIRALTDGNVLISPRLMREYRRRKAGLEKGIREYEERCKIRLKI